MATAELETARAEEINVSLYRAFKDALQVQDACNLTGIVHSYERVVDLIRADLNRFEWTSSPTLAMHPIAVLFASKLHDLSRLGLSHSERYGYAYSFANGVAKGAWLVGSEPYREALMTYLVEFHGAGLMQILINGNNGVVRRYGQTLPLGLLLNPGGGTTIAQAGAWGRPWALDNGAFGKTPEWKFWRAIGELRADDAARTFLLFVVPPDAPFDARGTIGLFWHNLAWLADADESLDLPLAVVGQDGMEDCDWDWFFGFADCFFIGGTTEWKLSRAAADLAREAKSRGLHVHMGRVNSVKRLAYAMSIGCDSVDGTGLTKFADAHLPRIKRRLFPGYVDMPEWINPSLLDQRRWSEGAMKVAELKRRLVPGTKLTRINCLMGPQRKLRMIAKVNSVDFMTCEPGDALGPLSHCPWPKASQLEETEKGFRIYEDGQIAVEYEWGHNPEPEPEHTPPPGVGQVRVELYTDAHVDYDGFSTRTEAVVGTSNRGAGREVRRITIEQCDYNWQTGRYASGMCRYTHERMKLENYVRFGDWTLNPEPLIDMDEFAATNAALGVDVPPAWVQAVEHADDDTVVIDGDHPDALGALFGVLGGGDD